MVSVMAGDGDGDRDGDHDGAGELSPSWGDGILSLASSSSSSSSETPYTCWEALEAQRSLDEWTSSSLSWKRRKQVKRVKRRALVHYCISE